MMKTKIIFKTPLIVNAAEGEVKFVGLNIDLAGTKKIKAAKTDTSAYKVTVSLSDMAGLGNFYADANYSQAITQLTIPAGTSSNGFYYFRHSF